MRLLGGPVPSVGDHPSALELDRFMVSLVRVLAASGRGWEDRAFALADELMAIRAGQTLRSAPAPRPSPPAALGQG